MPLKKLLSLFAPKAAPVMAPSIEAIKTEPVAPAAEIPQQWVDDTQLRELARENQEGITKWVLASDMQEFFTKLDHFNKDRPEEAKLKIEMLQQVHNYLAESRDKGFHITANHHFPGNTIVIKTHEDLLKLLGPQNLQGLRARIGGLVFHAHYSANPINTCMSFRAPDGEWRDFQFGIDSGFVFKEVPTIPAPARTITAP